MQQNDNKFDNLIEYTIFPLYDNLLKIVNEKYNNITDLKMEEMIELVEGIKSLNDKCCTIHKIQNCIKTQECKTITTDNSEIENIFVLIRIYALRCNKEKLFEIPFNGQKINNKFIDDINEEKYDIKFDIREFHLELKLILLEYIRLIKFSNI
jgi:hypothetical protein